MNVIAQFTLAASLSVAASLASSAEHVEIDWQPAGLFAKAQSQKGALQYASTVKLEQPLDIRKVDNTVVSKTGKTRRQITFTAKGATSLEPMLSGLFLPHGAELYWYSLATGESWGPITDRNNPPDGLLTLPLMPGATGVLEVIAPAERLAHVRFEVANVLVGEIDVVASDGTLSIPKSLSCNVDTACPAGDPYRNEIASVARYTIDGFLCSGQLINTTANDGTPYFMTARHCGVNSSGSFRNYSRANFYWEYESTTCRTPGSASSGNPLSLSVASVVQSGASIVSARPNSDTLLLRLNNAAPSFAYFTGWNRELVSRTGVYSIHHPAGDEKRISIDNNSVQLVTPTRFNTPGFVPVPNSHYRIAGWDVGLTEGGSSGGGLWDDGLLVGTLHGGAFFTCPTPIGADDYGAIGFAWTGDAADERLRDWLDPLNSGVLTTAGQGSCDAPSVAINGPGTITSGQAVTYSAAVSGGSGSYDYAWDINADGVVDGTGSSLTLSFPERGNKNLTLVVEDDANCSASDNQGIVVQGPDVGLVSANAPVELCGDGDAAMEPGEQWRVTATFRNNGNAIANGELLFVPAGTFASNTGGYSLATGANCAYQPIDIISGRQPLPWTATPGLGFDEDDEGSVRFSLGGQRPFFGQTINALTASTNGYLALSAQDNGSDYGNDCNLSSPPTYERGSGTPPPGRLAVGWQDLSESDFYHQSFATCPRPGAGGSQACDVMHWSDAEQFSNDAEDMDFQAVLYADGEIVYQFLDDQLITSSGSDITGPTIGLQSPSLESIAAYACGAPSSAPREDTAQCFRAGASYDPNVTLLNPLVNVANLAPNQTTQLNVDFRIGADAACDAHAGIQFAGFTFAGGQNGSNTAVLADFTIGNGSCNSNAMCLAAGSATPLDSALYWNPARGGNGLDLHALPTSAGSDLVVGWYTGDDDREPVWYFVPRTPVVASQAIAPLMKLTLQPGPFNASNPLAEMIGNAVMTVKGSRSLVFAAEAPDGLVIENFEYFPFGAGAPTLDYQGQWFQSNQPGWGLAMSYQGTSEAIAAFIYDEDGEPVWTVGVTNTALSGPVPQAQFNPHCPTCAWSPSSSLNVGIVNRTLLDEQQGQATIDITLERPLDGDWQRNSVNITNSTPEPQ